MIIDSKNKIGDKRQIMKEIYLVKKLWKYYTTKFISQFSHENDPIPNLKWIYILDSLLLIHFANFIFFIFLSEVQ